MNHCIFTGNLGADPELRTANGKNGEFSATSFRVAVNRRVGKEKKTVWVSCEAIGKQAELICQYFQKGSLIRVFSEYDQQTWEKDGEKKYRDVFDVSRFEFPEPNAGKGGQGAEAQAEAQPEPEPAQAPAAPKAGRGRGKAKDAAAADEDIPF